MRRILITGAKGQLGVALKDILSLRPDIEALYTDADTLDITDAGQVERAVMSFRPDMIVNAAAYTAVDRAETEISLCERLNAEAPAILAGAAARSGARLIHISTDYVFSGSGTRPYRETDSTAPSTVYGRTKLAGENTVRELLPDAHVILRTAWLYSHTGSNFVKTMLRLGATRPEIGVVADQWGCPTYAPVLAKAILTVIDAPRFVPGTFHFTGSGRTTWYDFAKAIFAEAGNTKCRVRPLTSEEYPCAARRPLYSVLDCSLFADIYGFKAPVWQESLHEFFQ